MESLDNAHGLWRDLRALAHGRLQLLALEIQRAVRGLAAIAAFSVAAGLLLAGAWLGLMAAMVLWLTEHQFSASGAMLLAALLNGVGLWALIAAIRRECRSWGFSASLQAPPPGEPPKANP